MSRNVSIAETVRKSYGILVPNFFPGFEKEYYREQKLLCDQDSLKNCQNCRIIPSFLNICMYSCMKNWINKDHREYLCTFSSTCRLIRNTAQSSRSFPRIEESPAHCRAVTSWSVFFPLAKSSWQLLIKYWFPFPGEVGSIRLTPGRPLVRWLILANIVPTQRHVTWTKGNSQGPGPSHNCRVLQIIYGETRQKFRCLTHFLIVVGRFCWICPHLN